jgi:orotidine-5'-phosphate decarboxylase
MAAKSPSKDRRHDPTLIVALDYQTQRAAFDLIDGLNPKDCALKVGSEMHTLFGADFVKTSIDRGFRVFLDLKFHDIPTTVAHACAAAAELGVWMVNVHALGGVAMMEAARQAIAPYGEHKPLLIAVTLLTSASQQTLRDIGIDEPVEEYVLRLAQLSQQAGMDGVVCSAWEVPRIKAACGSDFLTVTPGIRLPGDAKADQVRVVDVSQAVNLGSDFLVVGRSITQSLEPSTVVHQIISVLNHASN